MRGQATSAIALAQAEASGKLKGKRFEVAMAFKEHGPGTSAEVLSAARLAGNNLNLSRARVTELADAGMLRSVGERKCNVTRKLANVWEFGSFAPRAKPIKPGVTKAELMAALVEAITVATRALDRLDPETRTAAAQRAGTNPGVMPGEAWIAEQRDTLNQITVDFGMPEPRPEPKGGAS